MRYCSSSGNEMDFVPWAFQLSSAKIDKRLSDLSTYSCGPDELLSDQ